MTVEPVQLVQKLQHRPLDLTRPATGAVVTAIKSSLSRTSFSSSKLEIPNIIAKNPRSLASLNEFARVCVRLLEVVQIYYGM